MHSASSGAFDYNEPLSGSWLGRNMIKLTKEGGSVCVCVCAYVTQAFSCPWSLCVCLANIFPWPDISWRMFILDHWTSAVAESELTLHVCSDLCFFCSLSDPGVSDPWIESHWGDSKGLSCFCNSEFDIWHWEALQVWQHESKSSCECGCLFMSVLGSGLDKKDVHPCKQTARNSIHMWLV